MYKYILLVSVLFLTACGSAQTTAKQSIYPKGEQPGVYSADEALSFYKNQQKKDKNNSLNYYRTALIYLLHGDTAKADEDIRKALHLDDSRAEYHFVQARLNVQQAKYLNAAGSLQNYFSLKNKTCDISEQEEQTLCHQLYTQNYTLESCGYKPNPQNILEIFLPALKQTNDYFTPVTPVQSK